MALNSGEAEDGEEATGAARVNWYGACVARIWRALGYPFVTLNAVPLVALVALLALAPVYTLASQSAQKTQGEIEDQEIERGQQGGHHEIPNEC